MKFLRGLFKRKEKIIPPKTVSQMNDVEYREYIEGRLYGKTKRKHPADV